jgi:hypothetical protein
MDMHCCIQIFAVNGLYKVSVRVCFLSEGRFTEALTAIVGKIVTEGNVTLLFNGALEIPRSVASLRRYFFPCIVLYEIKVKKVKLSQ